MESTKEPRKPASSSPTSWHKGLMTPVDVAMDLRAAAPALVGAPASSEGVTVWQAGSPGEVLSGLIKHYALEDLVAVSEPSEERMTDAILAAGARYVDVGRDRDFIVREDAMARVLADGARLVILANPCPVTGTPLSAALRDQILNAGCPLLVDETHLSPEQNSVLDPSCTSPLKGLVVVRRLQPSPLGGDITWVLTPSENALEVGAAISLAGRELRAGKVDASPGPVSTRDTAALGEHDRRAALLAAVCVDPSVVVSSSVAPFVFMRWPGRSGTLLKDVFASHGVAVAHRDHHTWRDGVRIAVPTSGQFEAALGACRKALMTLLVVLWALSPLSYLGCAGESQPSSTSQASVSTPVQHETEEPPPPGVEKRLFKTPLVGGCGRYCPNPRTAMTGMVMAMITPSADPPVARYVDSSQFQINDVGYGRELEQLWRGGNLQGRVERLEALLDTLRAPMVGVDPSTVLGTLETAVINPWPQHATAEWSPPDGEEMWRFKLVRRGREWLVAAVRSGALVAP